MRKLIFAGLGLVVLVVAGLLIGPSFFDWNSYKPQIAGAVKDALGRELKIVGDINLSILPIPSLSIQRVGLENVAGADNREMVAFDEVEVKVDVSALLQGKIAVKSVRLVRPVIALEITKDGRASWDIKLPGSDAAPSDAKPAPSADAGSAGGFDVDVSLESLRIEDATISYLDARSGLSERVTGLSTDISADSLKGPFRAEGKATARGLPLTFKLAAGRMEADRPLPVTLDIAIARAADLRFNGQLSALTPEATLSGTLEAKAPDMATAAKAAAGADLPAVLAKALQLNAEVSASATSVGVNKLSLRLGEMSFAGAIHGVLKPKTEIDIVLSASKIDLDALLSSRATAAAKTPAAATGGGDSATVETKLPQSSAPAAAFTLPGDMSITFDLGVETAAYKGGVIRNAALTGALRDGSVTLERLGATLPGSSDVTVTGSLAPADGLPQFSGDLAATSGNLRGLAQWLGVDPARLPADRLRNFSYTSQIVTTPKSAQITSIAMQLDASRITGAMAVELRRKPGIGLRLAVDKLNLDAYLPQQGAASETTAAANTEKPAASSGGAAAASGGPEVGATLQGLLDAFDANVELTAGQLSVLGETARTAKVSLTLFDEKLTINEASVADFAGIGASMAGTVGVAGGKPALGLDFAVAIRDAARAARFAGAELPLKPAQLGKLAGNGRIDATLEGVRVKADVTAIGAKTTVNGTVGNMLLDPNLNMVIAFEHSDLAAFARTFAPDYRPGARKLGPLSASLNLLGTAKALDVRDINVKAGPVTMAGTARLTQAAARTKIDLDLKTSEVFLDLFLPVSATPQTGSAVRGGAAGRRGQAGARGTAPSQRWSSEPILLPLPADIDIDAKVEMVALSKDKLTLERTKLHAILQSGRLAVNSFTAGLFGGTIRGQAAVEPRGKAAAVTASLTVDKIDSRTAVKTLTGHDRVQGPLSLQANLATQGDSEYSFVSGLSGNATVSGQAQFLLTKDERNQIGFASAGGALLSSLLGGKVRELQSLAPITQMLASLDQAFGRSPAQLSGDLNISKGVARTDNLTLAGQGNAATTRATIDLPRWLLDSATALIDDPKLEPLVTFEATGPLDAPSRTKVGGRLLKQGQSAVQEKATNPLQQVLPGLLGGGNSDSSAPKQEKVNPGKLLEGIFKQLQR